MPLRVQVHPIHTFLWGFLAPHEKALYMEFTLKRSEKTLFEFFPLKWKGDVQTDGGPWYANAFPDMPFIRHFECVGHLRSYVIKAMVANERCRWPSNSNWLPAMRFA